MRNFAAMIRTFIILVMLTTGLLSASSQDIDDPTFVPMVKLSKTVVDGDTIQYMEMQNVYVYPEPTFENKRQQQAYTRLIKNVKKVLPIAKEVRQMLIETAEYVETLPTKHERDEHLKRVEESCGRLLHGCSALH